MASPGVRFFALNDGCRDSLPLPTAQRRAAKIRVVDYAIAPTYANSALSTGRDGCEVDDSRRHHASVWTWGQTHLSLWVAQSDFLSNYGAVTTKIATS